MELTLVAMGTLVVEAHAQLLLGLAVATVAEVVGAGKMELQVVVMQKAGSAEAGVKLEGAEAEQLQAEML